MALGVGVWAGLSARSLEDDAHQRCATVVCVDAVAANDALARARTRASIANLGYGVGGVAVIAAAVLWFTGGRAGGGGAVAVAPVVAPGLAGARAAVRF